MKRSWVLLLSLLLLFAMGARHLPVPCMGDGHGHACQSEACACVSECSCQMEHHSQAHSGAHACCHPSDPEGIAHNVHLAPPPAPMPALTALAPGRLGQLTGFVPAPHPLARRLSSRPLAPPVPPPEACA